MDFYLKNQMDLFYIVLIICTTLLIQHVLASSYDYYKRSGNLKSAHVYSNGPLHLPDL